MSGEIRDRSRIIKNLARRPAFLQISAYSHPIRTMRNYSIRVALYVVVMRVRNEPVAFIRATARTRAYVGTRMRARARARHGRPHTHRKALNWPRSCIIRASAHIRKLPLVIVTTRGPLLLLLLPLLAAPNQRGAFVRTCASVSLSCNHARSQPRSRT